MDLKPTMVTVMTNATMRKNEIVKNTPVSTSELKKILSLSDSGMCAANIAALLKRSIPTVVKYLKDHNKYRPLPRTYFNPLSDTEKTKILKLFRKGKNPAQIAKALDRSAPTIRRFLRSSVES